MYNDDDSLDFLSALFPPQPDPLVDTYAPGLHAPTAIEMAQIIAAQAMHGVGEIDLTAEIVKIGYSRQGTFSMATLLVFNEDGTLLACKTGVTKRAPHDDDNLIAGFFIALSRALDPTP